MFLKKYFFFTLVLFDAINLSFEDKDCDSWRENHIFIENDSHNLNRSSICVEFASFEDLMNLTCGDLKFKIDSLSIYSSRYILLDNNLDIGGFMNLFKFSKIKLVYLQKIKGFNKISNQAAKKIFSSYILNLEHSKFYFYLDHQLITKEACRIENFPRRSSNYFGSIDTLFMINSPFYSKETCPYVFLNSVLYQLGLFTISNSFIFKNQFGFLDINQTQTFDLNVQIKKLLLNVAYEDLDRNLLNKYVFKELMFFDLTGIVYSIENDLFKNFEKIKLIILNIENFSTFFQSGLKWMTFLNQNINVELNDAKQFDEYKNRAIIVQFFDPKLVFNIPYEYPNEDFCLFKDFPHNQLIYPAIVVAKQIECSCTIYWLIQYSKLYLNDDFSFYKVKMVTDYPFNFETYSIRYCLKEKNYSKIITECNFKKMSEKCLGYNYEVNRKFTFSGNLNNSYHFKWLQFIIQVIIQSLLCAVGIFTNTITIIVITNLDPKLLDNPMYKHIRINSIFNIVYCFLGITSLMGVCIYEISSFCSSLAKFVITQYYQIYFDHFFKNVVRLCSNISYIALSLSRFLSTTKTSETFKVFKKFSQTRVKFFYLIILSISIILSMHMPFEWKVNKHHNNLDKGSPFDAYDINHCQEEFVDSKSSAVKCNLFAVLNMINNVVNNIAFLFLSVFIDICLIKFSNDNLMRKLALFTDVNVINEAKKFKKRINKMIISFGILYFLSHVMEFTVAVLFLVFSRQLKDFCYYSFYCNEVIELVQTFNFLSVSLQFFFFKRFDRNFSHTFNQIFKMNELK